MRNAWTGMMRFEFAYTEVHAHMHNHGSGQAPSLGGNRVSRSSAVRIPVVASAKSMNLGGNVDQDQGSPPLIRDPTLGRTQSHVRMPESHLG